MGLHWVRDLSVPMHPGLIDGLFVPLYLISTQDSRVPLPKFQMALRLKMLMLSGSKKLTQIHYLFLSKSPGKRIPSSFPHGAPMERDTRLQDIFISFLMYLFNVSFGFPSKGALPPGPPHEVPSERGAPVPIAFPHSSFKVLGIRPPSPLF